ncbi:ski oncogene-like [Acanthaster planci]|uniref:Ski oncogene-like n=1 Tax=Acanthaster planci TaxID=133434 RepID=A0A8B7XX58_ACAPL|nr:ski oncogene-like [Acanthaster planci]
MEQMESQAFKHNLDKVLKSYQTVAMSSLGGPSSYSARWAAGSEALAIARKLAGLDSVTALPSPAASSDARSVASLGVALSKPAEALMAGPTATPATTTAQPPKKSAAKYLDFDPLLHPPPFPIQQMPVFTPIDQSSGEKCETVLESETISCFIVGGEKRLCLPQILNSVLRDFSLQQINAVCEDLHIYCSRCSPEQLEILKITGILPASAPSCGLITKTDAERLCNALLYGLVDDKQYALPSPRSKRGEQLRENCFPVYHECFGKCRGVFIPDLYATPHAPCIECCECQYVFTPQKFVMHSHRGKENRTCHWGFDSANWRSYLLVSKDQDGDKKHQAALDDMKAKFDFISRFKRKHGFDENGNAKKIKVEEEPYSKDAIITSAWSADGMALQRPSAFRPWSPSALGKDSKGLPEHGTVLVRDSRGIPTYLSMGPPVLLNPERVVPHTAASNYDSHYAPNVTLAPPSKPETPQKSDGPDSKDSSSESRDRSPESGGSPAHRRRLEEDAVATEPSMEQEIELVRSMLEGDAVESRAGREKLLHELARIRMRQEERLQGALAAKKDLQQELEFVRAAKKEKLREAAETKRNLRKENERLRTEYERRLRELSDSKQHLKNELESLRNRRGSHEGGAGKERARLRAENDYMRERLDAVEAERDELQRQLAELHKVQASAMKNSEIKDAMNKKYDKDDGKRKADTMTTEGCPKMNSPSASPKVATSA